MLKFTNLASTLANAVAFFLAGADFLNIITSTLTQVKTGLGVLSGIIINTAGTTSAIALFDGISSIVTMTKASPGVISWVGHPFQAGDAVKFSTTGALYTGLTAFTTYYVSTVGLTADAFVVADTQAHALAGTNSVATTGTESGVQTAWDVTVPIGTFSSAAQNNLPSGNNGIRFQDGLIAFTTDGGGAADVTVLFI